MEVHSTSDAAHGKRMRLDICTRDGVEDDPMIIGSMHREEYRNLGMTRNEVKHMVGTY